MKVLLINGSPKDNGNTAFALSQMDEVFHAAGVETEILQVGSQLIRGCTGCGGCYKIGKCVFDDCVNETAAKLPEYDSIVIGSPVYYASPNGTLLSFLDRLFYSSGKVDKRMKVGASVVVARREQVTDLLENGKMETTFYRAKEVQPVVEKMITLGKKGDLPTPGGSPFWPAWA